MTAPMRLGLGLLFVALAALSLPGCTGLVSQAQAQESSDFGYPGSSFSSFDAGPVFGGNSLPVREETPLLGDNLWDEADSFETAALSSDPGLSTSRSDDASDPFADLNRSLSRDRVPMAPAASAVRKFRVIATAQGDIGLKTATGFRMQKWSVGAALPSRRALERPIQVQYLENGLSTTCTVLDVGPWNTRDPYWEKPNGRPQAESGRDTRGRRTNKAGIDLFNATWYKLLDLRAYDRRLLENTTGEVEWAFNG